MSLLSKRVGEICDHMEVSRNQAVKCDPVYSASDQTDKETIICKIVPDWDRNSRPTEVTEKSTDGNETEPEKGERTSSILLCHETDDDAKIQSNELYTNAAWEGMLIRASICPTEDTETSREFQQYL